IAMEGKRLLIIGPEPPPATGMELATRALVAELRAAGLPYLRLDTADPGDDLANRGRWTAHNLGLAMRHLAGAIRKLAEGGVELVYLPIAQEFPALFRDVALIAAGRIARKPVVIHLHGGMFHDFYASQSAPKRWLLRQILGGVTLGIVLTERLRPALECV